MEHNNELLRGSDLTGSQYRHRYLSSNSITINNSEIQSMRVSGVSFAAGLVMTYLALPGATAVAVGR